MCVTSLDKAKPKSTGTGYKVFNVSNKKLRGIFQDRSKGASILLGVWYEAVIRPVSLWRDNKSYSYDSGFHIFKTLEGARSFRDHCYGRKVYEIKYEGATYSGIDRNSPVIIAKYMKIIRVVPNE